MTFLSDIKKFTAHASLSLRDIAARSYIRTFATVVARTPVDTGLARANWQASVGRPLGTTTDSEMPDNRLPDGGGFSQRAYQIAHANFSAIITPDKVHRTIYLSNNLDYIGDLEFGGVSKQAPSGMARLTAMEFPRIVREERKK